MLPLGQDRVDQNVRLKILWLLRPHEWLVQFNHHLLDTPWPVPSPWSGILCPGVVLCEFLLLDERSHTPDRHAIAIVEVIAQIELVEVERDDEGGKGRRVIGRSNEGEGEVWSGGKVLVCQCSA